MVQGSGQLDNQIQNRWSAASAYLRPALSRPNLHTMEKVKHLDVDLNHAYYL